MGGAFSIFGVKIQTALEIAPWKIYEIFALDAGTYFVAFSIISLLNYVPLLKRKKETGKTVEQLKVGYQYLKTNWRIFLFGVASYSIFVTVLITSFYSAAIYVAQQLKGGGDVYATSEMYYAIGAVMAGFITNSLFRKIPIPKAIIIMTLMTASLYAVLVFNRNDFIFYGMFFILGLSNAGTRILRVTYLFKHIPNQVYGRAGSIFFLTNVVFRIIFLSIFALPFFQNESSIGYTFAVMSGFLFLSAIVLIRYYKDFMSLREHNHIENVE